DSIEYFGVRPFAARRVNVHSRDSRRRKSISEQALDLLRAKSALAQHRAGATRTSARQLLGVPAVVTDETLGRSVIREADRAVRTGCDEAARLALHERRVPASIEQQNALFILFETLRQRVLELLTQHETQPIGGASLRCRTHGRRARCLPTVYDTHVGQAP